MLLFLFKINLSILYISCKNCLNSITFLFYKVTISQQIVTKNRKVIFFMIEKLNENASLSDLITTFENVKDEL
ncbi:hypothetical protein KWX71_15400, partial [Clostridioides difficile]|nr:hypothetical protein [Clostridioides difficile]MBY2055273.1 hypothetical protein [Clostridioides difficile]MBZ1021754.1 hypothetical protein [Clostridioides difficile]